MQGDRGDMTSRDNTNFKSSYEGSQGDGDI